MPWLCVDLAQWQTFELSATKRSLTFEEKPTVITVFADVPDYTSRESTFAVAWYLCRLEFPELQGWRNHRVKLVARYRMFDESVQERIWN